MSTKMGRPKTPVGKAKTVLIGAKFSPQEAKQIQNFVAREKIDNSKWLRKIALDAVQPWVSGERWRLEDLNEKTVEFELILSGEGPIRGTGTFDVWQNGEGKLKIKIVTFDRSSTQYTKHRLSVYVDQEAVRLIKRQPSGSTCDFSLFDPLFQRYVRGAA